MTQDSIRALWLDALKQPVPWMWFAEQIVEHCAQVCDKIAKAEPSQQTDPYGPGWAKSCAIEIRDSDDSARKDGGA